MQSWTTSLFYTLFVLSTSIFATLHQKKNKPVADNTNKEKKSYLYIVLAFFIPWLVGGVRYAVAADYFSYIRMYNDIKSMGLLRAFETLRAEPGFALLNWIAFQVFGEPHYIFLITSFIVLVFIYKTLLNNYKNIHLGIALIIFIIVYYFRMWTFLRLSIAVAIIFFSYKYLIEKNLLKYSICVIMAFCFHYTAIIAWPVYFLINSTKEKKLLFNYLFFGVVFFLLLFLDVFFEFIFSGTKYMIYQSDLGNFYSGINQLIIKLPVFLLIIVYRRSLMKIASHDVYLKIYYIGIVLSLFTFWIGIIDRLLIYFFLVEIILIPSLAKLRPANEKVLITLFVISYYLSYFVLFILTNEHLIPYTTFWGWSL